MKISRSLAKDIVVDITGNPRFVIESKSLKKHDKHLEPEKD